jgi:hypothetical protein
MNSLWPPTLRICGVSLVVTGIKPAMAEIGTFDQAAGRDHPIVARFSRRGRSYRSFDWDCPTIPARRTEAFQDVG